MVGSPPLGHPRVLLVDDDVDIRLLVRTILEPHDFMVEEAESGGDALEKLDDFSPDVVVIDESMPGLSGSETVSLIRQTHPHVKIVVFSASIGRMSEIREDDAPAADADVWMPKEKVASLPEMLRDLVQAGPT